MGLSVEVDLAVAVVVLAAGLVQSITGFGFALLAVPLLSLVIQPSTAVVLVFLLGGTSSAMTLVVNHEAVDWHEARRLSIAAILAMPLGALLLVHASPTVLRSILGVATCATAAWMLRAGPSQVVAQDRPWLCYLAGAASGVLNTSLATNGPPLVAYLRSRGLEVASFRSTISVVFTVSNVVGLGILVAVGAVHTRALDLMALSFLPGLAGWGIGHRVARSIPAHRFDRLVDVLLLTSGVLALGKAVLG